MVRKRRVSERESSLRRHYRDWFLPLLNNFENSELFGQLVEYDLERKTLRPKEDPRFPLYRVVDAIKDVVAGEEDQNRQRYERGAVVILELAKAYPIRRTLAVRERLDPTPDGRSLEKLLDRRTHEPMIELFVKDIRGDPVREAWENFGLRIGSAESNGSVLMLSEFLRYQDEHKQFIQLGVCHDYMCNRLYLKAKGKPHQMFCSSRCRERLRYEQRKHSE